MANASNPGIALSALADPVCRGILATIGVGEVTVSDLGDHTFQLVINDALDLNEYQLELSYQPAVRDTLAAFSYVYPHIIYMAE